MTDTHSDLIRSIFESHHNVVTHLQESGEISYAATIESTFPKVMLLAAASNLEHQITKVLVAFVTHATGGSAEAIQFFKNKAIERQYHTLFDWKASNANQFFGLFGSDFKARIKEAITADVDLHQSVRDFLDLGGQRNNLVHGDYGSFTVDKSANDVLTQYISACKFVHALEEHLAANTIAE